MKNETSMEPTIFDTLTQSRELQMLKTTIPYLKPSQKRQAAIFIKCLEFFRAMEVFAPGTSTLAACELPTEEKNSWNMLNDMKKYATPRELELFDMLSNLESLKGIVNYHESNQ